MVAPEFYRYRLIHYENCRDPAESVDDLERPVQLRSHVARIRVVGDEDVDYLLSHSLLRLRDGICFQDFSDFGGLVCETTAQILPHVVTLDDEQDHGTGGLPVHRGSVSR